MSGADPGAYERAIVDLDRLTEAFGQAGNALVDAHWRAVEIVAREIEEKAAGVRVTPRAAVDGGRARLLFDADVVLADGTRQPLPDLDGRLDRHLRAIYAVAGTDEYDNDHHIDGGEA